MVLDIIAIIVSVIALGVSVFCTFWNARPHIKLKTDACVYSKTYKLLAVVVKYSNSSPVSGSIERAKVVIGNREFGSIEIGETFNTPRVRVAKTNGNEISIKDNQLRTPISVLPFQSGIGVFVFPNIDSELLHGEIGVSFYFYRVGSKRPKRLTSRALCGDYIPNATNNNYT